MHYFIFLLAALFLSCSLNEQQSLSAASLNLHPTDSLRTTFKPCNKLILTGDFNGDGKRDTLFENIINSQTKLPIDSFPDPYKNEWDTVVYFSYQNYCSIILTSSVKNVDTLILGEGIGLLSFINIGDNNHDQKDEIALVVDRCDFSRVNHCYIYSICSNKLVELTSFYIHEGAFDIYDNEVIDPFMIKGFFEKKKGKWMYLDYMEDFAAETEVESGKMNFLQLKSCKQ